MFHEKRSFKIVRQAVSKSVSFCHLEVSMLHSANEHLHQSPCDKDNNVPKMLNLSVFIDR